MAELRPVSAQEVAERLKAAHDSGALTAPPPPPTVSPDRWRLREAAALLGSFHAGSLTSPSGSADAEDLRTFVVQDCERVSTAAGSRWRLTSGVRTTVLDRLQDRHRLLDTLAAVEPDPLDIDRVMAEAYLRGAAPPLDEQTMDELTGTLHVVQWLLPARRAAEALARKGVLLPTAEEVGNTVDLAAVFQPLRLLAGEHFVGRRKELRELADYVEGVAWAEPGAPGRPPLLVHGPGGVGKSTLVARYLLDHAGTADRREFPFAYLTFDRADLLPQQPLTLLAEATRQLGLLYPACAEQANRLEHAVRSTVAAQTAVILEGIEGLLPTVMGADDEVLMHRFAQLVREASAYRTLPLLLVLDTLEQAQRHGTGVVDRLWFFLEALQRICPVTRVVFAGRAPVHRTTCEIPLVGLEPHLALDFLRMRLAQPGITPDDAYLVSVTRKVGASPLSLKLAAELIRREGKEGLRDPEKLRDILFRLGDAEVQAVLYERILDDLEDPDLQRIAGPGLTLRRITPRLIQEALAVPCGLGEISEERALRLFHLLATEATLVDVAQGEDVLVHRADVRQATLPLIHRKHLETSRRIHRRAVRHYAASDGPQARGEELYHRLSLGQATDVLDRHWVPEASLFLESALEELPPAGQAYLADRLGIAIDPAVLAEADGEAWARQVVRQARTLLDAGQAGAALELIRERPASPRPSRVSVLEIEALAAQGRIPEARRLVTETLERAGERGDAEAFADVAVLGARIAEDLGAYDQALDLLDQARRAAATTPGRVAWLQASVAQLRIYRRSGAEESAHVQELRTAVVAATDLLRRRDRRRHPSLVRELAAEVGDVVPGLLSEAARTTGIDNSSGSGGALEWTLTEADVTDFVNTAKGSADVVEEPPGAPERGTLSRGKTSQEWGEEVSEYLDSAPAMGATWSHALMESYRAEVDRPTFGRGRTGHDD
ncbi:AAA family ATPase [Streptomyces tanashiensis]|uniref:AAA family ATPase n=1 Tax=Streptomyces tanashiensis TaxID=67367 RepID=UPI0033DA72CF